MLNLLLHITKLIMVLKNDCIFAYLYFTLLLCVNMEIFLKSNKVYIYSVIYKV